MIRTIAQCFPKPKTTKFFLQALGDGVTFPLIATLKNDATGRGEFWNASPATPGPFQNMPSHLQHFMVFLQPPPDRQTHRHTFYYSRVECLEKLNHFWLPKKRVGGWGGGFSCGIFWVNLRDNVDIVSLWITPWREKCSHMEYINTHCFFIESIAATV